MRLNKYFKREEFKCKCGCGYATVDAELLRVLTDVRKKFDSPITINSGCRCISHNHDVGGRPNSKHIKGLAADIVVKDVQPSVVYKYLIDNYPYSLGLGNYETFTHVDSRSEKARWGIIAS